MAQRLKHSLPERLGSPSRAHAAALPLLRDGGTPFARNPDGFITVAAFRAGARLRARQLRTSGSVVNLCENRYRFLEAFAAARQNGLTTLLPASHAPVAVSELIAAYPGCDVLRDTPVEDPALTERMSTPDMPGDFVAAIAHTSGSTGMPAAHAKSWSSLGSTTALNAAVIRSVMPNGHARHPWIVATVPPQHMYGFEMSVLLPLLAGFGIHGGRPLLPGDVAAALHDVPAPRVLVSTPVHLRSLVESGTRFPDVAAVISATAPMTQASAARIEQCFSTVLIEMFGSTETCIVATRQTAREAAWRAYPGIRFESVTAGTAVNAPWLATEQLLHDVIELGDDGTFTVIGRQGDLIEVAGKRASLADLTRRLAALPGVQDAIVFQPPPESGGRAGRCAAFVVAPGASAREIARRFRQVVEPAFVPRPLVIVAALPRNDVGKIPLARLVEMLAPTRRA